MNSQALHETINVPNAGISDFQYPPQSVQNQAWHGESNFVDGSGPIFSMYLEMAMEEDKKIAENWKADADEILIFTGLFSAAVASLISVSIQDIRQNPQDTSNFYLANIYQTLADPNRTNISSSLPTSPPFSPPTYAVWVNALWFMSLVISLTCALLATLLQQWARRYLKVNQSRYSPHKRTRIRAFLAGGVEKLLLPWTVEILPALLHISLSLFFAGLVVFLWNVDITIFKLVLSWVGICTALYGSITLMPIFRRDSPYHTPLSLPVWHIVTGMSFLTFWVLARFTQFSWVSYAAFARYHDLKRNYRKFLMQGMRKTVEETALNSPSEIDTHAFLWTFDSLDEDHELERFFSGLPGFRSSKVVQDPLTSLTEERKAGLFTALTGLLDRTFSSDLLPEPVKNRRAIICMKALDPAHTADAFGVLDGILSKYQYSGPMVPEIMQIVTSWGNGRNAVLDAQATIFKMLGRVQSRDDSWFILASNALGVPETVLRDYAAHGDSLSLAILLYITHQQFNHYWKSSWPRQEFSKILEAASKFNVQDTSPELQHHFCGLWNHIVRKVHDDHSPSMAYNILRHVRNIYMALHQDTDSAPTGFSASTGDRDAVLWEPSVYPVCNIPGHHPDPTPHRQDVSASVTYARVILHDNAAPVPDSLTITPHVPSSSVPAPLDVDEDLLDAPPLDNNTSVSASFQFHPAHWHQTAMESLPSPGTSPDPVATGPTRDIETPARTTQLFTPEPSASTPPPKSETSTSPPDAVAVEHTADSHTSSLDLDVPPPPSPIQVLDNAMLPTEPQSSMLVPTTPFASPPLSNSAPDLGATGEDEDNPNAGVRKGKDAHRPSFPTIRENTNPEPPPQSLSPPPVTGVAIAGPSRSLDAKHTGDHPPQPPHGRDDIV